MLRGAARRLPSLAACVEQRLLGEGSQVLRTPGASWVPACAALQQVRGYATEQQKNLLFNASPESLSCQRDRAEPPEAGGGLLRRAALLLGGYYSRESSHMRAAEALYASVQAQAAAPQLLEALDVPSDFQHTHAMLCLHVWLLLVRLRGEGKEGKALAQALYDDFQDDVEGRVRAAGVKVRVAKTLTELEKQFYGSSMAYDKALAGGEDLAAALLRNVYQGDARKADAAVVLARYLRRELACLTMTESEAVMRGDLRFSTKFLGGQQQQGGGGSG